MQQGLYTGIGGIGAEIDGEVVTALAVVGAVDGTDGHSSHLNSFTRTDRCVAAGRDGGAIHKPIAIGGARGLRQRDKTTVVVGAIHIGDGGVGKAAQRLRTVARHHLAGFGIHISDDGRIINTGQRHRGGQIRRGRVAAAIGRAAVIRNSSNGDDAVAGDGGVV